MCPRGSVASLGDRSGRRDLDKNIPNYEVNAPKHGRKYGVLQHRVFSNVTLGSCLTDLLVTGRTRSIISGVSDTPLPFVTRVATFHTQPLAAGTRPGPGAIRAYS